MCSNIVKSMTPEEQELKNKLAELVALEEELAQKELELSTLNAELHVFERLYFYTVGLRLSELDELIAQVAELLAKRMPEDINFQNSAKWAREQARASAEVAGATEEIIDKQTRFSPSDEAKKLYRKIAKRIHPDLAVNEKERIRREDLMKSANHAFQNGDLHQLRTIIDSWESSPESVPGEGVAAELIRVIRKIAQVKKRLKRIGEEMEQILLSDLYQLKIKVEDAESNAVDLLSRMASQVEEQIEEIENRLLEIIREFSTGGGGYA